jgi:hypothetical protein
MFDPFRAFERALIVTGYKNVQSVWVPRLCPTGISGQTCQPDGSGCSLHNYRIAVDIDPYAYGNPHFKKAFGDGWDFDDCKVTRPQVEAVEQIRNAQGEQMFRWLGWSIGDTMHFESQVPPARTTVNWDTVPGTGIGVGDMAFLPLVYGMGFNPAPADSPLAGQNSADRAQDVIFLQNWLHRMGGEYTADPPSNIDGKYGNFTVAQVAKYVGGSGKAVTGWGLDNLIVNVCVKEALRALGPVASGGMTVEEADARYQAINTVPPHGHKYAAIQHPHTATVT